VKNEIDFDVMGAKFGEWDWPEPDPEKLLALVDDLGVKAARAIMRDLFLDRLAYFRTSRKQRMRRQR
jgi:hypothetical protein